jgi:Intracellular proteinase inhibitor
LEVVIGPRRTAGPLPVFLLALFAFGACGTTGQVAPATPDGTPVLLPSMQVYTMGEEVNLVLQVTNTSRGALELTFPTGQTYDFAVRRGGREVWRWSEGQVFTQAVREERLEPGETVRHEARWPVPAAASGEYEAVGILTALEHRVEQVARFELR